MIWVVFGGQYGSEGKGAFCAHLARTHRESLEWAVRGGGPQAGHTFWHDDLARKAVVRQVPVAAAMGICKGYIGPGAIIDVEVIEREITEFGLHGQVWVHPNAVVVEDVHRQMENDYESRGSIPGSTKEGVGAARSLRALRAAIRAGDLSRNYDWVDRDGHVYARMLRDSESVGFGVMAEGTQGFGLSLFHGQFPYVTSADCTPAAVLSECGLPIRNVTQTIMVVRTFPIRVGGNSGPLAKETTWDMVGVPPEVTTVTKRQRRVGEFSLYDFVAAFAVCQPSAVALMFADYMGEPERAGRITHDVLTPGVHELWDRINQFAPCRWIGTGGRRFSVVEVEG